MKNTFRTLWLISFIGFIVSVLCDNTHTMLISVSFMWVFLFGVWASKK